MLSCLLIAGNSHGAVGFTLSFLVPQVPWSEGISRAMSRAVSEGSQYKQRSTAVQVVPHSSKTSASECFTGCMESTLSAIPPALKYMT